MKLLLQHTWATWQKITIKLARRAPLSWFAFGLLAVVIVGGLLLANHHAPKLIQNAANTQDKTPAATKPSSTPPANTANSAPASVTNTSSTPSASSSQASDTNTALAISLSASSATIATGGQTPTFTATSLTGKPLAWIVSGGGVASPLVASGTTNGAGLEVSHNFSFGASVSDHPGTYTYNVIGYIPRGASVSKQFTLTVTQGPTFTLVALPADHSTETATTFMVPFEIRPLGGALSNVNVSATVINSNGVPMSIAAIEDMGSTYYNLDKHVVVYDNGLGTGQVVIRATVSDSTYTTSVDLPYNFN